MSSTSSATWLMPIARAATRASFPHVLLLRIDCAGSGDPGFVREHDRLHAVARPELCEHMMVAQKVQAGFAQLDAVAADLADGEAPASFFGAKVHLSAESDPRRCP